MDLITIIQLFNQALTERFNGSFHDQWFNMYFNNWEWDSMTINDSQFQYMIQYFNPWFKNSNYDYEIQTKIKQFS